MDNLDVKVLTKEREIADWIPFRAHEHDAGGDLCAAETVTITPQTSVMVKTGIAVDIPHGYVGLVFSRSGMAKKNLRMGNCVGVIDSGYRGEIGVFIYNDNADWTGPVVINIGDRIAQLVIIPIVTPKFRVVNEFKDNTIRGEKGFGSTGT